MSLGTSNRDGGKTSESGHLRSIYKAVVGEVLSGLAVSQRGAGANMSVDIAIGDVIIPRSDATYGHPAFNDAVLNQAITTADPSNPRRDILVIYVDYGQAPSTAVSNNTNGVVKVKVVAGTPAGSPVDPTDAAIQSSVGAGNPFSKLARIRVGAGVTSIGNSVIDDLRTMASGLQQRGGALVTQNAELASDVVASGLIWTGDAYASTRNASMTAGVVYINGLRISIAAVVARAFTASRDTYVDVLSNGDGTGTVVYTEVTNGAAAPALAANSKRVAKIITGASNIAAATSIVQGGQDSLFNVFYMAPNMKGAQNGVSPALTNSSQNLASSGLSLTFNVPARCNALVTIDLGISSQSDFEYRPQVWLNGVIIFEYSPSAGAGNASNRSFNRGFSYILPLPPGVNVISAGVSLSSSTAPQLAIGAGTITAEIQGRVTA